MRMLLKVWGLVARLVHANPSAAQEPKKSAGLVEGITVIYSNAFVFGILVVSTCSEGIGTILDFQMVSE